MAFGIDEEFPSLMLHISLVFLAGALTALNVWTLEGVYK